MISKKHSKKYLLLLGGNALNAAFRQWCDDRNYSLIVVDWRADQCNGDLFIKDDIVDFDRRFDQHGLRASNIVYCYTSVDVAVPAQNKINRLIGYEADPFLDEPLSKLQMRRIWAPILPIRWCNSLEEYFMTGAAERFVIKSNQSSSSRGVFMADRRLSHAELTALASSAEAESRDGQYLVEDFFDGTEFNIEGIVDRSGVATVFACGKKWHSSFNLNTKVATLIKYSSPAFAGIPSPSVCRIKEIVEKFEVKNCLFHLEVIIDPRGQVLPVEIGFRSSGIIAPLLVPHVSGADQIDTLLGGRDGAAIVGTSRSAAYMFLEPAPGARLLREKINKRAGSFEFFYLNEDAFVDERAILAKNDNLRHISLGCLFNDVVTDEALLDIKKHLETELFA